MLFALSSAKEKIVWTTHSKMKMRQYGFSEQRVMRIMRKPEREEVGIAPKTIASMQLTGTKKRPTEAWMMYQLIRTRIKGQQSKLKKIKIISAWRYPGRTPEGARPIIPEDVLRELKSSI